MKELQTFENSDVSLQEKLFLHNFVKEKQKLLLEYILAVKILTVYELLHFLAKTV